MISMSLQQCAAARTEYSHAHAHAVGPLFARGTRATTTTTTTRVSKNDKDVELFETIGTPADRTSFEPFAEFKSILGDEGEEPPYDPLRDGPLRYLGYSNEVGEAFSAWLFPGGVTLSYAVAISYVVFDTVDKYRKTLEEAQAIDEVPGVDRDRLISTIALERGFDTIVWQLLASVALPGYTIHTVVAASSWALQQAVDEQNPLVQTFAQTMSMDTGTAAALVEKSLPTFIGLCVIPFIVHPLDAFVHYVLNVTTRPLIRAHVCDSCGGRESGLGVCEECKTDDR